MLKDSKKLILGVFGLLSLVLLLTAATYAFFSSASLGDQITSITTNGVTFSYKEGTNSIRLNNAMPMTDEEGMYSSNYFEFDITAKTPKNISIPYYITARKKSNSSNIDEAIKIYLTKVVRTKKDVYAIKVVENYVTNNTCNTLNGYEQEYYKAECNKLYSVGDTYNIYTIRLESGLEFDTLQQCENSEGYAYASGSGIDVECIPQNNTYTLIGYMGNYNDSSSCLEDLGEVPAECITRQVQATTNIYHNEFFIDDDTFDDLESCNAYLENNPYSSNVNVTTTCALFRAAGEMISEEELLLTNYDELNQFTHDDIDLSGYTEKLLYNSIVNVSRPNYKETYRLRTWIDYDADFTLAKYNNANFSLTVNVYSTGNEVTGPLAGLYDEDDNLIETYENLVSLYGFNPSLSEPICNLSPYGEWLCYDNSTENWNYVDENNIPNSVLHKILSNSAYSDVTKIVLPNDITTIGDYAFADCDSLTSIVLPAGLETIGTNAFVDCSNLLDIEIPSSVTAIGGGAFSRCTSLEHVELPNTLTKIEDSVFARCYSLKNIDLPSNLVTIGDSAFDDCGLTSITLPASITTIDTYAFIRCGLLETVILEPNSHLTSIGTGAFDGTRWGEANAQDGYIYLNGIAVKYGVGYI